jgi:hypothetical protein
VASRAVDSTARAATRVEACVVECSTIPTLLPGPSVAILALLEGTPSLTARPDCAREPSATSIMAERHAVSRHAEMPASVEDFMAAGKLTGEGIDD